jgi:hypothetical protein
VNDELIRLRNEVVELKKKLALAEAHREILKNRLPGKPAPSMKPMIRRLNSSKKNALNYLKSLMNGLKKRLSYNDLFFPSSDSFIY